MGIKDFYKLIKEHTPEQIHTYHLSEFRGYRFAVDISIFLNKYIRSAGEGLWISTFFNFLCILKKHGIKTVCVFDGPNPPKEKLEEQQKRRDQGKKGQEKLKRLKEIVKIITDEYIMKNNDNDLPKDLQFECEKLFGTPRGQIRNIDWEDPTEVYDVFIPMIDRLEKSTIYITNAHREKAKEIVEMMGLPYFQASGEAEALCSFLAMDGKVDAVLTEDTDVVAYGCPWLVSFKEYKLKDERVCAIHIPSLREELGYSQKELTDLCILLQCDYNKRVKGFPPDGKKRKKSVGLGVKGSFAIINEFRSIDVAYENNAIDDITPLKHERCREIFTNPSKDDLFKLAKILPNNKAPDISRIEDFIQKEGLSIRIDYIKECWKSPKLIFRD